MPSGVCNECKKWHEKLELDHITPKFRGGLDDTSNLQWLCPGCHKQKSSREKAEVHRGNRIRYGVARSPEERRKISEGVRKWFSDPKNKERNRQATLAGWKKSGYDPSTSSVDHQSETAKRIAHVCECGETYSQGRRNAFKQHQKSCSCGRSIP